MRGVFLYLGLPSRLTTCHAETLHSTLGHMLDMSSLTRRCEGDSGGCLYPAVINTLRVFHCTKRSMSPLSFHDILSRSTEEDIFASAAHFAAYQNEELPSTILWLGWIQSCVYYHKWKRSQVETQH